MLHRIIIILLVILCTANPAAVMAAVPPDITAEAGCLINISDQHVLYEKRADRIMYPASTTKIMTLLVALKQGDLDSVVTVDAESAVCEGSSLYLKEGDQLTLHNLLYGMMLVSGNDAAEAAALSVAGSKEKFVELMNAEAKKIGANRTHFENPHGLPNINHYTTARDLALITASAYKIPGFADVVASSQKTIYFLDGSSRTVFNTNRLLRSYPGANGVKTGFTNDAGCCLVAAAKRNGIQLVAVVLNDDERWDDASSLLDYGFQLLQERNEWQIKKAAL